MSNEVESISKKMMIHLRSYPSIFLEGLRKTTKILDHDSWGHSRDSKWLPREYKSEEILLKLTCLVRVY
jgi:hypothetical protein